MAVKVHNQAKYCRCCGNETKPVGNHRYCMNQSCKPLGHQLREYCEHDGAPTKANGTCTKCTRNPLGNR